MKLRSGKILEYELPIVVEEEFQRLFVNFKQVYSNRKDFGEEMLKIIADVQNMTEARHAITNKVDSLPYTDSFNSERAPLLKAAGEIFTFKMGKSEFYKENNISPNYEYLIKQNILSSDLNSDIDILGNNQSISDLE